ncbi:prepilin-type N-terminal cleavage/methylation domain-containing protein [Geothrix paludis]|uniref:prepilin-type N-terminal cleavage/methylation domain-containing protein n=1 Tax=Geothrix paludis TaxID=2922722 RepID=UPI00311AA875
MKKQSGFTLIELLLVLAIIGIISAIAIPALLSQRARARDKASIDNMVGRVGDLVGQWDKSREAGTPASGAIASMQAYLTNTGGADKNPWNGTAGAPSTAFNASFNTQTGNMTASAFATACSGTATTGNFGQAQFSYQIPTASGAPGFFGGAVYVQNKVSGKNVVIKVSSLE